LENEEYDRARIECLSELADPLLPWFFRFRYNMIVAAIAEDIFDKRRYLEDANHALEVMEDTSDSGSVQLAGMRACLAEMQADNDEDIVAHEECERGGTEEVLRMIVEMNK